MAPTVTKVMRKKKRKEKGNVYHYVESGLKNVFLAGGVESIESPYGRAVSIADLDGLHRCISRCLVEKPQKLSGAEFRFLRAELDLSQRMVAQLCGREERIIRKWEAEDEVPDPANTIIRVVYKERLDPTATYEGLAKVISQLQQMDKKYFEMRLTPTKDGWCKQEAA